MLGAQVDCLLAGWPSASPPLFCESPPCAAPSSSSSSRPASPLGTPPEPGPDVELEAASEDGLLAAAHEAIAKRGQRARAVSFTPTGLVAYAEAGR